MDDMEDNVHGLDGATISLYQHDPEHGWSMGYQSHPAIARYGNYDSFSDGSSGSNSDGLGRGPSGVLTERKSEMSGLLTTSAAAARTTTTNANKKGKVDPQELPGLFVFVFVFVLSFQCGICDFEMLILLFVICYLLFVCF